jgi:tetratricopeptide (TPR) repeat protein
VRVCRRAFHPGDQQRGTCYNLNKLHQLSWVLVVAVFLVYLALFSSAAFGQTSTDAAGARSPWAPRDSSADGYPVQNPSPYVVSVSHLKVPAKAISHLEAAQKRFAKMQLAQTTMELDRAIDIYPGFAQAFCMKALVSLAEKDFTDAVENAAHAIRLDGADSYSWVALATAYNSLNEWPEAEAAAGRALALDPSAWQGHLELAKSFYGEAKFALALYILDQLNRDIPDVHLVRANSLMGLGRPQEAARQFSVFLQEAPDDSRGDQIRQILLRVQSANNQFRLR